jgi:ASC-1-like (ASCH) protein
LLVNGKLYDSQNRLVKGFSGKIVFDKEQKPQKVILITEENEFKEFSLKEENLSF